jgi:hypothetical protein
MKWIMIKPTCCGEHLSIWTEAAVKYSGLMCWYLDVAHQGWIAPDAERVVREATCADDLLVVRAPSKASNLRASVNAVDSSASCSVPEVNVTVVRSSTSSENIWLPWAPAESLDGGLVVGLCELGDSQGASIPDGNEVVVSTSRKLCTICAPLKTTDLGCVRDQLGNLVLSDADIMVEDKT